MASDLAPAGDRAPRTGRSEQRVAALKVLKFFLTLALAVLAAAALARFAGQGVS
jgi:hypothetical protein